MKQIKTWKQSLAEDFPQWHWSVIDKDTQLSRANIEISELRAALFEAGKHADNLSAISRSAFDE